MNSPRVLIEEWLPAQAIGIECMRENSTGLHPPPNRLHIWWARRPLTISRAAVLGSLLPADFDRGSFERLLGFGVASEQIVAARRLMDATTERVGFGCGRAFSNRIPDPDVTAARRALSAQWGSIPIVLDPMAGGGSIPLEAARLGFPSMANELNPVACVVLEATVDYPFRFGKPLAEKARAWANKWLQCVSERLVPFYARRPLDLPGAHLFARTVPCPDTGHPTPLVPDWSLSRPSGGPHVVAEPVVNAQKGTWTIRVRNVGREAGDLPAPPRPTYSRGKGVSLFTGGPITADYIKAQARLGRMGSTLYAVETLHRGRGTFRPAEETDLRALEAAERELERLRPGWEKEGIIPTELYPEVSSDERPRLYGMPRWSDLFSPRQLLSMGVLVEELRRLRPEILAAEGEEMGEAVVHLLALVVDKFADFSSRQTTWHPNRGVVGHTFQRHDFAFKPTFAEMAACAAGGGVEWAIDNVLDAYEKLADLPRAEDAAPVQITQGSATNLAHLEDGSVTAVVVDPPYADNVQYSELADFFYVWLKRTQGHRRPEWFATYLCDRDLEAVVNPARHSADGGKPKDARATAHAFYQSLMTDTFREARRVLRDDGVLTVMFTHKQQSAWAALFQSLIEAGFTITATWPVQTESGHSLNIAGKNAAQSTVILVARKRDPAAGRGYYDDAMRRGIRDAARGAAERLRLQGLSPLDQLVGSFGSAMEVFSRHDRVVTDTGEVVGVAEAIEAAAEAVIEWRVERIAARGLEDVDPESRFYLLCWDVLRAGEFRFNEAMLLGRAVGMGVDQLMDAGLVKKAGEDVRILPAGERRRDKPLSGLGLPVDNGNARGRRRRAPRQVHPNDAHFDRVIDFCHALAMRYADAGGGENGIGAAKSLALRHGWRQNGRESAFLEALLRTAPEAVRYPAKTGKEGAAERYPEFRAWHSMFRSLTGREPEEWRPPQPPSNLFTAAALAEEEREEDVGYADAEDEETDEEGE